MIDLLHARAPRQKLRASIAAAALLTTVAVGSGPSDSARAATTSPGSPAAAAAGQAAPGSGRATFGIKPSHPKLTLPLDTRPSFEYTATPGAQQTDYVAVSNNALSAVTLSVYASDGFNTESAGFDLLVANKKPVDLGSWVTLKTNTVTIPPDRVVVVPFVLKVPAKVGPGDHVGGIVASLRTYAVDKKGNRVAIDQRVGARIYMRVQGPLTTRLAVTNLKAKYHGSWWNPFSAGKATISYTVVNAGNVRLGANGSVTVGGWFGSVSNATAPQIPELLPDNSHTQTVVLTSVTPAFHEHATVTVTPFSLPGDIDGQLVPASATVHFWAIPWALLAWLVLLLLLLVALLWTRRRRRRAASARPVTGDDRNTVGAKP